jgi:hypothetical protein
VQCLWRDTRDRYLARRQPLSEAVGDNTLEESTFKLCRPKATLRPEQRALGREPSSEPGTKRMICTTSQAENHDPTITDLHTIINDLNTNIEALK